MAADTIYSIAQIEVALAKYFDYRANVIVPNVSWGFLNHEADLLIMNKTGYLTEIEIKRSWADFLADFRKDHTHDDSKISWFYYAVPESIVDKCKAKLAEIDPNKKWGLIRYGIDLYEECYPCIVYMPSNSTRHQIEKKLTIEEQFKLARLGVMRTWSIKEKIINTIDNSNSLIIND